MSALAPSQEAPPLWTLPPASGLLPAQKHGAYWEMGMEFWHRAGAGEGGDASGTRTVGPPGL
jgi:hypothetical protein